MVQGGVAGAEGELNNRAWAQRSDRAQGGSWMGDTETLERKEDGIRHWLSADHTPATTVGDPHIASHVTLTLLRAIRVGPLTGAKVWLQRTELGSEPCALHGTACPSGTLPWCFTDSWPKSGAPGLGQRLEK